MASIFLDLVCSVAYVVTNTTMGNYIVKNSSKKGEITNTNAVSFWISFKSCFHISGPSMVSICSIQSKGKYTKVYRLPLKVASIFLDLECSVAYVVQSMS